MVLGHLGQVLAYPVGIAVSNVVGKVIDNLWTQPQAHKFRLEETEQQHKLRAQEQKKQLRFRLEEAEQQHHLRSHEQKKQHKYRLKELEQQHEFRLEELRQQQQSRFQEIKLQYEQNIIKSFIDSGIRIQEQEIIESLKASYSIYTNKVIRSSIKEDVNSPFYDEIEVTYKNLKTFHKETKLPIVLVSSFWDDSISKPSGEQGGYVDFRNAFNSSYRRVSWNNLASKQDGHFKRPLYQTDRDVNYIYSLLSDIPIILVYGTIQGVHTPHQHIQRIHPHITFWNLLPEQKDSYANLDLQFFPFQIPINQGQTPNLQEIGKYSLNLQDIVGKYLTQAIGLLSTFYHLHNFGTRPNLQQFQLENEELEIISLQVEEFYERYKFLCELKLQGIITDSQGDTLFI